MAENERLVEVAHESAEILKKSIPFDSSISTQSSSNYFFEILEIRERRNIFENSRMRMMVREAAGLVKRLEEKLSKFVCSTIQNPKDVGDRNYSLVHEMRHDILDHTWIFALAPEHVNEVGRFWLTFP